MTAPFHTLTAEHFESTASLWHTFISEARVDQWGRDRWIMQPEADVELQHAALAVPEAFD